MKLSTIFLKLAGGTYKFAFNFKENVLYVYWLGQWFPINCSDTLKLSCGRHLTRGDIFETIKLKLAKLN